MARGPATTASDESLMLRFQRRRDRTALQELASRFAGRALAVARQALFDRALAEDAVQEAFLRIMRAARSYDAGRPFSVWFYTILRNICTDMLRKRGRDIRAMQQSAADQELAVAAPSPEDPADVARLLADLPAPVRRAVVLRVIEDLPFRDVAAALGIGEEAAKKRVQRGLRTLRDSPVIRAIAD